MSSGGQSELCTPPPGGDWNGGFNTFSQLKSYLNRELGALPKDYQYHHIVEQSQIKKTGFDPTDVHNINNVVPMTKELHERISGYYSSIDPTLSKTMIVRDWLANQDFQKQLEFGIRVLRKYGVAI